MNPGERQKRIDQAGPASARWASASLSDAAAASIARSRRELQQLHPVLARGRPLKIRGALPVQINRRDLLGTGVIAVDGDLLSRGPRIRHDGRKVARWLLKLARGRA
ncbi:MAG TPA: hypothetical protein VKE49_14130 [Myxococcaceae bacterium]|nr:hypothetical protein [Myxococcaceae bacterium]